ncbi:MAG: serine hydrolase [SAR86 cluster bacterium]|uniref:Serine hydrolase n=1 Tax=SAR86 cluster bacterium TaxID=2030880 RepID=A0A2A4X9T5_9GAMM|nr:MAG: serine hydrolase [SAR86 cluster bacterium]
MIFSKLPRKLVCLTAAVCLSTAAIANHHGGGHESSIKMIDSNNFGIDQSELQSIREQMQAAVDGGFVSGNIILVGNNEGVGVLETVGTQGPNQTTEMNDQTLFRIYSMTKPIVSVATMSMVEDGLISIADPVSKYIPEFANMQVIDEETGEITAAKNEMTVQHLLTHESGLIYGIFDPESDLGRQYFQAGSLRFDITALELAQNLAALPLRFEPGTKWNYSRSTDVLGAVIEVAAGKPLDALLKERIFDPLGMDETTFYVDDSKADRIANPIHGDMDDPLNVRAMLSGGGGLHSTTEDYVRFANMLLNGGEYRGARIISEATLNAMNQKFIGDDVNRDAFFFGPTGDWGLGFHLQPIPGADNDGPFNFGWQGVGGTVFIVDPENDFFMIYMAQVRGGPRGAPMDLTLSQRAVYEAMLD